MKRKQHAWLALSIAIMSGYMVTSAWRVHVINKILGEVSRGHPPIQIAQRLDNFAARVKRGEVKIDTAADRKLVTYALNRSAEELRTEGHFYRDQAVLSRYQFYTALTVFVVQLAVAISTFFIRCEVSPKPAGTAQDGPDAV